VFVVAENKLFDGGGRRDGMVELSVCVLVGLNADELKELGETGLAPNAFLLETVGRVAGLDETIEFGGGDVCTACGGDSTGVAT